MYDFISLDLETTGFSPESCDIIEIGAWKVRQGVVTDKFCTLVRPIMYIPRSVQELTGITMEDVAKCETIEPVLLEFFDWCENFPFLGHNLSFDYRFLLYKGKHLGLDFSLRGTRQGIDTLNLCKKYLHLEKNSLESVAKNFEISMCSSGSGYHRAGFDSYVTKLVYDRFMYMFPNVLDVSTPVQLDRDDKAYGKVVNNDTLSFI